MNVSILTAATFVVALFSIISPANSLHLAQVRNLPEPTEATSDTKLFNGSANDAAASTSVKANINIGSLTSLISNPTQLINQLQSTINSFLQVLNSTLSGGSAPNITLTLGSKNITVTQASARLEDVDLLVANITEIVKNSTRSDMAMLSNSTDPFTNQVHGALEDFRKAIMKLRTSVDANSHNEALNAPPPMERRTGNASSSNGDAPEHSSSGNESRKPNGLPLTLLNQLSSIHSQVDSRIQRSLSNARSSIEDSLSIARQSSHIMRNQTSGFMSEVQRVFNEFSAPFRNFIEALRRGRPTAVVAA